MPNFGYSVVLLAVLLQISSATFKCNTCASRGFWDYSNYFFTKKGLPDCNIENDKNLEDCPDTSFCIAVAYAPPSGQNSFMIRGCYATLLDQDFSEEALNQFNLTKKPEVGVTYVTFAKDFGMTMCRSNTDQSCNKELSVGNGKVETPTSTSTISQLKNNVSSCYQCDAGDETCDHPRARPCAKDNFHSFCYSKIGVVKGARYQRFGCSTFNPYLIPDKEFQYKANETVTFKDTVVTAITHKFCTTDNCNKSASAIGFNALLILIVAYFFF
ncbi:hypothetical protein L596_000720 [Steinernema carpocapsae]|uniref:UPAR/Ly6 domain-containing protein n=1 Tax=Steinernema carpocapsae TaxID=34508 RepID=A0A4U8UK88_STECR|nr:hypothetical protein L596_000720 [Steinernema carpocapsae]